MTLRFVRAKFDDLFRRRRRKHAALTRGRALAGHGACARREALASAGETGEVKFALVCVGTRGLA